MAIDCPWLAIFAYYAVTLRDARERSHIRNFIDWLVDEAAAAF